MIILCVIFYRIMSLTIRLFSKISLVHLIIFLPLQWVKSKICFEMLWKNNTFTLNCYVLESVKFTLTFLHKISFIYLHRDKITTMSQNTEGKSQTGLIRGLFFNENFLTVKPFIIQHRISILQQWFINQYTLVDLEGGVGGGGGGMAVIWDFISIRHCSVYIALIFRDG